MLLKEYKALFVHVPKAAGQSVENYLLNSLQKTREQHGGDYLLKFNDNPLKGPERLAHLAALDYIHYNYITEEEFNEYFKFTVVRNPWSRMVSFFKFMGYSGLISFNDFIKHYLPYCFEHQHWFFKQQVDFIYNEDEFLLIDFVARMENLEVDFAIIADKLKLKSNILPKNNQAIEKSIFSRKSFNLIKEHPSIIKHLHFNDKISNYKDAYNATSLNIVAKYYEKDIDLLKYAF